MLRTTIGLLVALLVAGCYAYVAQPHGFNQLSRFDMLYAMTAEGRLEIDTLHGNTADLGAYNGHFYSDKPPGVTYLALPAYTLTLGIQKAAHDRPFAYRGITTGLWMATLGTSVLLSALGAMAMWTLLCTFCRNQREALLGTLACWLGTLAFPYGSMLFSHASVMGLLSIAMTAILLPVPTVQRRSLSLNWWQSGVWLGVVGALSLLGWTAAHAAGLGIDMRILIVNLTMLSLAASILLTAGTWNLLTGQGGASERRRRDALVGLALGLAVLSEFMAVIPVGALWIVLLTRDHKRAGRVVLWAILPMLLLPLTNWLSFDSPFRLGYNTNNFEWMRQGFLGFTFLPNPFALLLLLFSGGKGLLFWSPCLALAVPGFQELYARNRTLCIAIAGSSLLLILMIASTGNPGAGIGVGPRYLAPIIPLLILPMVLGLQTVPRLGVVLIAVSIGFNAIATVVNPMPDALLASPLTEYYFPALVKGELLPNVATLLRLHGVPSLFPLIGFAATLLWTLWRLSGTPLRKRVSN